MIADLKADSERWDAERRQTSSRGQPQNGISSRDSNGLVRNSNTPVVEYRASTTHQSRQYYGPTETGPSVQPAYPTAATSAPAQGVYDSPQYQSSTTYASQPSQGYGSAAQGYGAVPQGYGATAQGYASQDQYYVAGAKMEIDQPRPERDAAQIPRTNNVQSYAATPTYQQDGRYYTQPGPSPVPSSQGYSQQSQDPFYGRGA